MGILIIVAFVIGLIIGFIAGYIEREEARKNNTQYEAEMRAMQLAEQSRLYKDNLRLQYMVGRFSDELLKYIKSPDICILIEKIEMEAIARGVNPQGDDDEK